MNLDERRRRYRDAVLQSAMDKVASAGKGGRGPALYAAGCELGRWAAADPPLVYADEAEALLLATVRPLLDRTHPEREARDHIRRGLRTGAQEPGAWPNDLAGTTRAPLPQVPRKPVPKPLPAPRPPAGEVAALWGACRPVTEDPEVSAWLRRRGLDPHKAEERNLARALPEDLDVPRWARCEGRSWGAGWRCLLPAYDASGCMVSLRARWVKEEDPPGERKVKESAAAVGPGSSSSLVLADGLGVQLLRTGAAPGWWPEGEHLEVVVVEGSPDFLTWATRYGDAAETAPAVFGIWTGGWTSEVAGRVPKGSRVAVRTDLDEAGEKYARDVLRTLTGRCEVLR